METENKVQAKVFQDAPGATEEKYHKFTEVWVNITSLTKSFYKNKFPENAFTEYCSVREVIDRYLEQLIRFFQAKSEISEKEFKTSADPKILKKIVDKYTEIDACYENSRNLIGIHPAKINEVNVCR